MRFFSKVLVNCTISPCNDLLLVRYRACFSFLVLKLTFRRRKKFLSVLNPSLFDSYLNQLELHLTKSLTVWYLGLYWLPWRQLISIFVVLVVNFHSQTFPQLPGCKSHRGQLLYQDCKEFTGFLDTVFVIVVIPTYQYSCWEPWFDVWCKEKI